MHSLLGRMASPARHIVQNCHTSSATLCSARGKFLGAKRSVFHRLNVSKTLCSIQKGLIPSQRRLTSSAILRCRLPALRQYSILSALPRIDKRINSHQMIQICRFSIIKSNFRNFTELSRNKYYSFFIAVLVVIATGSFLSYGWYEMKLAQMSTWTKRIYDTFVLLDIVEKYVIEPTKTDVDAVFCALARDGGGVDRTVSVQQLRANPFVKRCLAEHETDLAEIFEEEDKGEEISWNVVFLTLGVLYLLSRDHASSTEDIHGQMYLLVERLAKARGQEEADFSSDNASQRYVSAIDVQSWLQALAYLGVIRGANYLEPGSSMRPTQVQEKVYDELFESRIVDGRTSAAAFLDDAVIAYLDYDMFVGRNTFFTAGAALRELRRREDYLYGDTYGHVSKGEGPVSVMGQDSDLGTAEAGPSGDADVTDPNSS